MEFTCERDSANRELAWVGEPKCFSKEKFSRLPELLYPPSEITLAPDLSCFPRRIRDPHLNGWLNVFRRNQYNLHKSVRLTRVRVVSATWDHVNSETPLTIQRECRWLHCPRTFRTIKDNLKKPLNKPSIEGIKFFNPSMLTVAKIKLRSSLTEK